MNKIKKLPIFSIGSFFVKSEFDKNKKIGYTLTIIFIIYFIFL